MNFEHLPSAGLPRSGISKPEDRTLGLNYYNMDSLVYMAGTAIAIISTPLWLYFRRSRSKK